MAERLLDWFSKRRLFSVVLDLVQKHLTKVEDAVAELDRALELSARGQKEEALHAIKRVYQNEEEADRIRRKIVEELAKGELKTKDREDLAHLVRRNDIVADWTKDAAWNLETLTTSEVKLPTEIREMLVRIGHSLIKEVRALRRSIAALGTDSDAALKAELEVENLEHIIDEDYHATKKLFLGLAKDLDAPTFMVLRDLLKDLEQVSDFCEDAGDMVRSIVIRISRHP